VKPVKDKPHNKSSTTPRLVGIGASAGGLKALQGFFEVIPDDCGLAFVVIVHLDPERKSEMAPLLQSHTSLKVTQVVKAVRIEPGQVYVIPPGKRILVTDGHLQLFNFEEPRGHRMPIDQFFRSLAEVTTDGIAVLLSGGGSDGVIGLQEVKGNGGLVFAQSPEEAEVDSMPRAAIDAGVVDIVLPVRELAQRLLVLAQKPSPPALFEVEPLNDDDHTVLKRILSHLKTRTGHDFSQYRRSTVMRRIARRMQVTDKESLADYYQFQLQEAEEARSLFHDLLIGVTTFFRDAEAFDVLHQQVLPKLFTGKGPESTVRVWTPGCATGEEAYSLAMLLSEYTSDHDETPQVQIFASDLSARALAVGREGRYPKEIETDIPERLLKRFMLPSDQHYEVVKELREIVLFAQHDLNRDPPFSQIDLISCRNLLIYLDRPLQERIFEIFLYALRPGGYLFLGNSETPSGKAASRFKLLSKPHRLFQCLKDPDDLPLLPHLPSKDHSITPSYGATSPQDARSHCQAGQTLHHHILENVGPPSVLVDQDNHAINFSESVGRYLLQPAEPPTKDMTRLTRPELRQALRSALYQAFEKHEASLSRPLPVKFNGSTAPVQMLVRPAVGEQDGQRLALVVFLEHEGSTASDNATSDTKEQLLEVELRRAQEELQSVRENADISAEELRASNEELQSMNEEYRSTTEELETSKEELQSINEELQTVNLELKTNLDTSAQANADMENLIESSDIGTLFLDTSLRIKRLTPRARELFHYRPADHGRPIGELKSRLKYASLETDVSRALGGEKFEREVVSQNGVWYVVRLQPYRDANKKIDGVVVAFVDISLLKRTEHLQRQAKEHAELIVATVREGLLILNETFKIQTANQSFFEMFQISAQQVEGHSLFEINSGQWQISVLRDHLEKLVEQDMVFDHLELTHNFQSIGKKTLRLNARRFRHGPLILLAIQDITQEKTSEHALSRSEQRLNLALDAAKMISCDWNVATQELQISGDFNTLLGAAPPRTIDEALVLLHPDEPCHDRSTMMQALLNMKGIGHAEFRVVRPQDTQTRWFEGWGFPFHDGDALRIAGVAFDISERKRSELQLREQNEMLERRITERTKQVRELGARLTMAEHQERHRIAQILHDDLQQLLYCIQLKLSALRNHAETAEHDKLLDTANTAEQWLAEAITTARELAVDLSPPILKNEGLIEALRWLITQMKELHGLEITLDANTGVRLSKPARILLFQAVRELLFNVVKHANVQHAGVDVHQTEKELLICVRDQGQGFDVASLRDHAGFGVMSVEHRLSLLGGRMDINSHPQQGTSMTIHLPLELLEESSS